MADKKPFVDYAGKQKEIATGDKIPIANLAIGTPDGTKFIRDDGTLVTVPIITDYVDRTTNQTVAGNKTFTGIIKSQGSGSSTVTDNMLQLQYPSSNDGAGSSLTYTTFSDIPVASIESKRVASGIYNTIFKNFNGAANAESMRIMTNGTLAINTTTPSNTEKLNVVGGGLFGTNTSGTKITNVGAYNGIWFDQATPDLTNFSFLYDYSTASTVLNGPVVSLRAGNLFDNQVRIFGTGNVNINSGASDGALDNEKLRVFGGGIFQPTASNIGLRVIGAASQTADLFQLKSNAGTDLVKVDANGNAKIGGGTNANAILEVVSTTKGVIPAPIYTIQAGGLPTGATGMHLLDADGNLARWNGSTYQRYAMNTGNPRTYPFYTLNGGFDLSTISIIPGVLIQIGDGDLTANATINMSLLNQDMDYMEILSEDLTYTLSFSGQTVYAMNGTTVITSITPNDFIQIRRIKGKLRRIN